MSESVESLKEFYAGLFVRAAISTFTFHYAINQMLIYSQHEPRFPYWIGALLGINTWFHRIGLVLWAAALISSYFLS